MKNFFSKLSASTLIYTNIIIAIGMFTASSLGFRYAQSRIDSYVFIDSVLKNELRQDSLQIANFTKPDKSEMNAGMRDTIFNLRKQIAELESLPKSKPSDTADTTKQTLNAIYVRLEAAYKEKINSLVLENGRLAEQLSACQKRNATPSKVIDKKVK